MVVDLKFPLVMTDEIIAPIGNFSYNSENV